MKTTCGKCNEDLSLGFNPSEPDNRPCPKCGSLLKRVEIVFEDQVPVPKEMLDLKGKQSGKKKPVIEYKSGDEIRRSTGEWVEKVRVIDREHDKYLEKVVNPETHEVIHSCDEALSKHTGHGTAKNKDRKA